MLAFIRLIRSVIFDILFYTLTTIYLAMFWPWIWLLPRQFTQNLFRWWTHGITVGLKFIVGLTYEVEGIENFKKAQESGNPVIVASRHESAWDTFIFARHLGRFAIVLKKDLLWIPLFGSYLKRLNSIAIDRKKVGTQAIRMLRDQAKQAVEKNLSILIFPEGTRCAPFEEKELQPGVSLLYQQINACVVPVSHNAGTFWGRRSKYKKPGHITLKFHEPIPPGLERENVLDQIKKTYHEPIHKL